MEVIPLTWLKKKGFYFLLLAVILDFLTPYILGFFHPALNQMAQVISLFGEPSSPVRQSFLIWSVVAGSFYTLSVPAIAHYFQHDSNPFHWLPAFAIGLYGVGDGIFTGIFSVNPQLSYWDFSTWIHNIGSGLGYTCFLLFPFLLSINYKKQGNEKTAKRYLYFFGFNLLFASFYGITRLPIISQGTIFSPLGFWQRVSFIANYSPILTFALTALNFISIDHQE